ncbi:glycosyltransferase family 2 protein [Patescibacteria group bacterium]|nr:glycosyltransferase family 2 protein [Patescibacteria group bacterium]
MFWLTLFFALFFSRNHPAWVAVFIILFDLYWLFKAVNGALHLISAYRKYKYFITLDWLDLVGRLADFREYLIYLNEKLDNRTLRPLARDYYRQEIKRISALANSGKASGNYRDYYHLVLYPFVDEGVEVLQTTVDALRAINFPKDRIMIVLASEERAGEQAKATAEKLQKMYEGEFFRFFVTVHPDGLPGEIKGKSANASYAVQSLLPEIEKLGISVDQVLVSNFDSDTIVDRQYFSRLMYEFLTAEKPYRSSYQPIAVYNNNIWDSPSFVRVVSVSNTFWQFIESSRPDRLRTFSSHSMTLRALIEVGFWRKDLVNEDGYIFWQCYLHYEGDYRVIPLFVPVSLDTCLAESYKKTLINQYKQKRRWAYNVEYYPSLVPAIIKSKAPFWDKLYKLFMFVEGNYNWATASVVISALGWLPLFLGGSNFGQTVIAANLPFATRILMTIATFFLIFSVYVNMYLLPPRPKKYSKWRVASMYAQWVFVPFISIIFGSLPAIEAQTRLMFGRYMEFWVTPKIRKE